MYKSETRMFAWEGPRKQPMARVSLAALVSGADDENPIELTRWNKSNGGDALRSKGARSREPTERVFQTMKSIN
jgi:hypothetical protein